MLEAHFSHLSKCDRKTLHDAEGRTFRQRFERDIEELRAKKPSARLGALYWRALQQEYRGSEGFAGEL
eukprot:10055900-Lingulodinium_polyedra.AAC.1